MMVSGMRWTSIIFNDNLKLAFALGSLGLNSQFRLAVTGVASTVSFYSPDPVQAHTIALTVPLHIGSF